MIIDTHTHWPVGKTSDPTDFLEMMDSYGIDRAMVCGWEILFKRESMAKWNDKLAEFCRKGQGRIYPLATVHLAEGPKGIIEARRCVRELDVKGFKVHPWLQGESLFQPAMDELCRLCGEHGLALLFHDGTPPYALPSQVGLLAELHPETTLILGHGGILYFWEEAIEVARAHSNVIISLCGQHPRAMQRICEEIETERIIFGTDFLGPGSEPIIAYRKGLFETLDISAEQRKRILWDNPVRIFHLSSSS